MKTRVAIVGLGRLGKKHAQNLAYRIPGVELTVACSLAEEELQWAKKLGVRTCSDYEKVLADNQVDAVFLVSATAVHSQQIIAGLKAGKHVFCEKPMALHVKECLQVEQVAAQHKEQVCAIGFVRRYDPSYYRAWKKIQSGEIGNPFFVHAFSADVITTAKFQIPFAKASGGLFVDMNIHDVDLVQWLSGSRIAEVTVCGGAYAFTEFAEYGDADNAFALCRLENGRIGLIGGSRTAANGHATFTEIKGTKGDLTVGRIPSLDRLQITDEHGVRHECTETFYDRFQEAFLLEASDFIRCIQEKRQPRISCAEATDATRVAVALREAYQQKRTVTITRSK